MSSMDAEGMPSMVLREEHQVILRVICILEKLTGRYESGESFEAESLGRCVEFFRLFADACHHAKEEDLLFPVLESRGIAREGGPIGVMLHEHRVARGHVRSMAEALEADGRGDDTARQRFVASALQYVVLLRQHIDKEDNVLYPIGDRVMTDEDQSVLCGRFCEVGCAAFEGKRREELERMADELEARWVRA